jgi:type II secretory pathway pseudopilin PulG
MNERGFTIVDVVIALMIMMVGLLALVAAIAGGIVRNQEGAQQLMAKHYASSTLESIYSARDIGRLGFDAIGNRSTCPGTSPAPTTNIFPAGVQPILAEAGDDNIIATCDDTGTPVLGFSREIIITDICDPDRPSPNCTQTADSVDPGTNPVMIRQIVVNIFFTTSFGQRRQSISSVITNYATE